jgi:photosystem II stability/assembly factor-like uncharacterized protein
MKSAVLAVLTAIAALHFRNIGPTDGRLDTVAGVPGDPRVYYAGGLGGLFKSDDGGTTWQSIFNNKPVSAVNAIAVAPSDPHVIYIGTGEANLRNDVAAGDGVWRSDDAGTTWMHLGLDATRFIAAIAVDPHDAQRAYVAALGDAYKPTAQRGVYRTTDGGKSWERVLFTDERTGASSIAIDPADPRVLIAGMWEGWRTPYHLTSGGATDGLYLSTDGGDHWSRMHGAGLPSGVTGRIAVAFAPSDPNRVYALIESAHGSLWRSDDRGTTWKLVNTEHRINQRPFYFTSLTVDPANRDHVYFASVDMFESLDGGVTTRMLARPAGFGDDHQFWIDPTDTARMAVAGDDGVALSMNAGGSWSWKPIAVAQSYHISVDDRIPYTVCSEDQDAGSACGPSNSLESGGIALGDFFEAGGGESGWILFDGTDSNVVYADGYGGAITRYDRRTQQAQAIAVWPEEPMGWPAAGLTYRFQWTAPLAISPQHPHRLYMGGNEIFQTDDGGRTWHAISPDLTRKDASREQISGTPITPDNTSAEYYDVVYSIAPSPLRDGTMWAGTDDGLVWLTRDNGAHWHDVTPSAMKAVPNRQWLRVDAVAASPFDPATAYVAADGHEWGDPAPHLYVTHDFGASWSVISNALPGDAYARVIRPDPFRRGMLYAGTANGVWFTFDEGATWTRFANGLPTVPVYDVQVQRRFDDLVVGTHGRGIWILDDLHPLQELTDAVRRAPLHLFTLRDAYRYRISENISESAYHGENPPYGAPIDFWLADVPNGPVRIHIFDGAGIVRTMRVDHPVSGVNRTWWDLRYDSSEPVSGFEPRAEGGFSGALVAPGTYTVHIDAGTHHVQGRLHVLLDPRSHASTSDLRAQVAFVLRVHAKVTRLTETIEQLQRLARTHPADAQRARALIHAIYAPEITQDEDGLRYPAQVYERLSYVASQVASADAAPTASEYAVLHELETRADALIAEAAALLDAR